MEVGSVNDYIKSCGTNSPAPRHYLPDCNGRATAAKLRGNGCPSARQRLLGYRGNAWKLVARLVARLVAPGCPAGCPRCPAGCPLVARLVAALASHHTPSPGTDTFVLVPTVSSGLPQARNHAFYGNPEQTVGTD